MRVHGNRVPNLDLGYGYLFGSGATLHCTGATVTNDLLIAGLGDFSGGSDNDPSSALFLKSGSRVTGSITLEGAAGVRAQGGVCELAGPIDGEDTLYLFPDADTTLRLSDDVTVSPRIEITAPTNYTELGVIACASPNILRTPTIRNRATLLLETGGSVTNVLYGTGTYAQTNDIAVTFTRPVEQGAFAVEAGTVTLSAASNAVGLLKGDAGTIVLAASEPQLMIGSDGAEESVFRGAISPVGDGSVTLVKVGSGTQTLSSAQSFSAVVIVKEGVLKLSEIENVLPIEADVTVEEGATLDLAGVSQRIARLTNHGAITNSSEQAASLTTRDADFGSAGSIADNVRIVIDGGTAKVATWRDAADLPVQEGLSLHLDGADLSTLVCNADNQVTNWADKSGHGRDFSEDVDALTSYNSNFALPPPLYDPSLYGGRGAIQFDANYSLVDGANRLSSGEKKYVVRTVFIVT